MRSADPKPWRAVARVAVLLAAVLAGQASAQGPRWDPKRHGLFVLKVSPAGKQTILFNGKAGPDGFRFSGFTPARYTGFPAEGYLIGRAKAGETVALHNVGAAYACAGNETVAFRVDAGQVLYLGDVDLQTADGQLVIRAIARDSEGAKAYLASAAPELVPLLQDAQPQRLKVTRKCPKPGPDFIYIPVPAM